MSSWDRICSARPRRRARSGTGAGTSCATSAAAASPPWRWPASTSRSGTSSPRTPGSRWSNTSANLNKPLPELLDQVRNWKAKGYTAFKVKVGRPDIAEDVERLIKIREIIGGLPLMVDANQAWDIGQAVRRANAYQPLAPYFIEEPMPADDIDGHARLRPLIRTPIALGENVYTIQQWSQYLSRGAVDFVQADVCRVGGITPYLDIAALARAHGIPLAPHFVMELSAQLLCCLPHGHMLEDVEGGSFTDLLCLVEPTPVRDGNFTPRSGVLGHGIVFNEDYLKQCAA